MQYLRQSTAVTLKIGPFLDVDDGDTEMDSLTISQADVRLSKNGGNFAQKSDGDSCTHDELGFYNCAINTTDTNTVGRLLVAVHVATALSVWHEFMVIPQSVYDSMVAGTDTLPVDAAGVKKNAALNNFPVVMVLSSDHVTVATGKTVTGERSIDGGAFEAVDGTITEVSDGLYQFDADAADTNGDFIVWRFSATSCDDTWVNIKTEE